MECIDAMKLRNSLLLALLLSSVVPLATVSYYTASKTGEAFASKEADILNSVVHDKSTSLAAYFQEIDSQLEQVARSKTTIDAMGSFSAAFERVTKNDSFKPRAAVERANETRLQGLKSFYSDTFFKGLTESDQEKFDLQSLLPKTDTGLRLQALYISDNPNPAGSKNELYRAEETNLYTNYHAKYHGHFNRFLIQYGYYDIFLVDPDSGKIVYSVFKEIDFATSLIDGPYAESGIGQVFNAAINQKDGNDSHIVDYSHYLPSYNAPALFTSRLIKDSNDTTIGVLIFQVPVDQINDVVGSSLGLGESGKSFLYSDEDGMLRSQLRHVDDNTILTPVPNRENINLIRTSGGYATYTDYMGNGVESVISAVENIGLNWNVVTQRDTAEAFKEYNFIKKIYMIAFAISLLVAIGVALLLLGRIKKQLGAEPDFLDQIATEIAAGNLSRDFSGLATQSGTLKTMVSMQQTLKARDDSDREVMTRISQLRDGLQKITTPVALADEDHTITFINCAMGRIFADHADNFRSVISSFDSTNVPGTSIACFSSNPDNLRSILNSLNGVYECEFIAGDRIFNLVFNSMYSDSGDRVGTSVEWQDVTIDRRVMEEVDTVVTRANDGDLSPRVNENDKHGIYLGLSKGLNGLLDINQKFVSDVSSFLAAISAGDLTKSISGEYQGAFAAVKRDANLTVEKLTDVVYNIRSVAGTVNSAAGEINSGNIDLSRRTELAAASLEETSSSMMEMTQSVMKNAEHSKRARELALNAMNYAQKGGLVVGEAVSAMDEINDSSRMISEIIGVIDDIAFQTNLLALNASVEAARAGQQGRGFAVVASEVRNLAGRSATAAKEIKELIEDSVQRVGKGAELVNQSGKTLDHIVSEVNKVADVVTEISEASEEQSDGIGSVNTAVGQLDEATQQNASLVEEASAASQSASEQAENLIKMIEFFATAEQTPISMRQQDEGRRAA